MLSTLRTGVLVAPDDQSTLLAVNHATKDVLWLDNCFCVNLNWPWITVLSFSNTENLNFSGLPPIISSISLCNIWLLFWVLRVNYSVDVTTIFSASSTQPAGCPECYSVLNPSKKTSLYASTYIQWSVNIVQDQTSGCWAFSLESCIQWDIKWRFRSSWHTLMDYQQVIAEYVGVVKMLKGELVGVNFMMTSIITASKPICFVHSSGSPLTLLWVPTVLTYKSKGSLVKRFQVTLGKTNFGKMTFMSCIRSDGKSVLHWCTLPNQ